MFSHCDGNITSHNSHTEGQDVAQLEVQHGSMHHVDNVENEGINKEMEDNNISIRPCVGMTFGNEDEAYNYYNMYARCVGFSVRKDYTKRCKKSGKIISRKLVCSKEGHKDKRRSMGKVTKQKREVRDGCLAGIYISERMDGQWEVKKFYEEHTHPLATPSKIPNMHSHKEFSKNTCGFMTTLHRGGLGPSRIAKILKLSGEPNITTQDCIDHLRAERENNVGQECMSVISYFKDKQTKDENFFYRWELEADGTSRSFFWADNRARDTYMMFRDVVVFDTTYRTNKFCMPFAPFTGINHHRRSCLFGCALLADETEETFIWLFEVWLECMHGKYPTCIITDQDIAMSNAIRKVFPHTRHIYCFWHIQRNTMCNLQDLYAHDDFKADFDKWIFKSSSVDEAEASWFSLKEKYDISEGHWLMNMYNRRHQWIPVYYEDLFTAGMRTTQRAESINSFFDGFVNANTSLHEFVRQYDLAVQTHREAEERDDFKCFNSKAALVSENPLEEYAGSKYTENNFCIFQEEFRKINSFFAEKIFKDVDKVIYSVYLIKREDKGKNIVEYSSKEGVSISCSCKMFEKGGIFCAHILHVLNKKRVRIFPEKYLLHRWTVDARYSKERKVYDNANDGQCVVTTLQRWTFQTNLSKIKDIGLRSFGHLQFSAPIVEDALQKISAYQVEDVTQPCSTSNPTALSVNPQGPEFVVRDPTHVKSKGRPKKFARIKSGVEISMSQKYSCKKCGKKGHNARSCPSIKCQSVQ